MSDQALAFHALTYMPEGDDVVVGRPDIDSYAVLTPDAAEALRHLEAGESPTQMAEWYLQEYGEKLDVEDYLETLRSLDFVAVGTDTGAEPAPVRFRRLGRILLGVPALLCYLLLTVAAIAAMIRHPNLAPRPQNVFFVPSLTVVEIVAVFAQLPLLAAHEAFHALAGRRLGLRTTLGMTRRLYFLVFETRLTGLMSVPRRQRYLCFLAGMIFDVIAIAGLTLIADALSDATGDALLLGRLALAMAFPVTVRLAYQFALFLQTDLYYVASAATGCYDLHGASKAVLRDWGARLTRNPDRGRHRRRGRRPDLDAFTTADLHYGRAYAPIYVVGVAVLVAVWVLAFVPVLWTFGSEVYESVASGVHDTQFVDRAVFVALNVAEIVLLSVMSLRARLVRRRTESIHQTGKAGSS